MSFIIVCMRSFFTEQTTLELMQYIVLKCYFITNLCKLIYQIVQLIVPNSALGVS